MLTCDECQQTFCQKYGLRRHQANINKHRLLQTWSSESLWWCNWYDTKRDKGVHLKCFLHSVLGEWPNFLWHLLHWCRIAFHDWLGSSVVKEKFRDDLDGVGNPAVSLPLFFWGRRSCGALIFRWSANHFRFRICLWHTLCMYSMVCVNPVLVLWRWTVYGWRSVNVFSILVLLSNFQLQIVLIGNFLALKLLSRFAGCDL